MQDIVFLNNEEGTKFNFRVGALIVSKDKVLLQHNGDNEYYSLIGGRVKFGESTEDALIRELEEETGIKVDKKEIKLITIMENFFKVNNIKYHELLFIYKIENNKELEKMDNFKTLDSNYESINKWFNKKDINDMYINPYNVKTLINTNELERIINKEY